MLIENITYLHYEFKYFVIPVVETIHFGVGETWWLHQ